MLLKGSPTITTQNVSNNTWELPSGFGFSQTNVTTQSLSNEIITTGNPFAYKNYIIDTNPVYGKVSDVYYK